MSGPIDLTNVNTWYSQQARAVLGLGKYVMPFAVLVIITVQVMDMESDEYKRILKYIANTHAPTHDQYKLKVVDVSFKDFPFRFCFRQLASFNLRNDQ